jgi:hypothetical protein
LTTDIGDNDDDLIGEIYVETETGFIYEVKFFEEHVLVRPASPQFYCALRKISHLEFSKTFHEYYGDHDAVRDEIRGMSPEIVIY